MKIVCTVGQALSRVPVNVVVCQLMIYSNVTVGITIFRGSFMFSQSRVKVPASLTNVGSHIWRRSQYFSPDISCCCVVTTFVMINVFLIYVFLIAVGGETVKKSP